ncbi:lipoprotein [Streptomyces glaucosporus]|uniref:Lipoprotein n=1 Tax=Streptomyces glaucosporus TaxID=284044 RepID=A0ABP5V6M7_9ACTN
MKTRATRLLPAAAAVLALGFASACGGSGPADGEGAREAEKGGTSSAPADRSAAPSPVRTEPAAPANLLSRAELEKAALKTADVSGYTVKTPSEEELSGAGQEKAERAECRPIASVIGGAPRPEPAEMIHRQFISTSDDEEDGGLILFEMLAAYEQEDANSLMEGLRKAVKACAGGFTTKTGDGTGKYSAVRELAAPTGADDALAYQVVGDMEGDEVPLLFKVVRSGSTVAFFYSMNLTDFAAPEIPQSVVAAQIEKLER